jgi:hypothetical protein
VVGHDRGARVTWRMAVEHQAAITKAAVLDIVPLPYSRVTKEWATQYFHWFFLIQPAPFPETIIGNSAECCLRSRFLRQGVSANVFTPEAIAEYLRCFKDPATIHATCEDYRAGASIDLDHAGEDGTKKVRCPLLVLRRAATLRLFSQLERRGASETLASRRLTQLEALMRLSLTLFSASCLVAGLSAFDHGAKSVRQLPASSSATAVAAEQTIRLEPMQGQVRLRLEGKETWAIEARAFDVIPTEQGIRFVAAPRDIRVLTPKSDSVAGEFELTVAPTGTLSFLIKDMHKRSAQ